MATLLTNQGRTILTARLMGNAQTLPINLGWGTGAGVTAAADTTLFVEDAGGAPAYARVAGLPTQQTTTVNNDTYQVVGTLTANAVKTITNVGLFDGIAGGMLFYKADFAGLVLNAGDSVTFTLKLQFI